MIENHDFYNYNQYEPACGILSLLDISLNSSNLTKNRLIAPPQETQAKQWLNIFTQNNVRANEVLRHILHY